MHPLQPRPRSAPDLRVCMDMGILVIFGSAFVFVSQLTIRRRGFEPKTGLRYYQSTRLAKDNHYRNKIQ